jgi:hypothetical protein
MPRRSRIGRLLAALFIRGAEAPFLLRDLDDSFNHDVARGLTPAEVHRRDLRNILASAGSIWAESLRPSAWRPSPVDFRLGLRMMVRTPGLSVIAICALGIGIPVRPRSAPEFARLARGQRTPRAGAPLRSCSSS